jgi:hypothetical protein
MDYWDFCRVYAMRSCEDEACVRSLLAQYVGGQEEVDASLEGLRFRVDVLRGSDAFEVKFDGEIYDGWGQALVYRAMGYKPHLFNFLSRNAPLFDAYVAAYRKMLVADVCIHIVTRDGRCWSSCL